MTTPTYGQFTLKKVKEDDRNIIFHSPINVIWEVQTISPNFRIYVEFEHSLNFHVTLSKNSPMPWRLKKDHSLVTKKELEASLQKLITFELIHSFFHPSEDPNYSLLNWALYGNLKDLVTCTIDE